VAKQSLWFMAVFAACFCSRETKPVLRADSKVWRYLLVDF
jgi:hypothetical protein